MSKGVKVYKFKSTGETVMVPPVSSINMNRKIMRQNPPPDPPKVKIDMGNGEFRWEENRNDPDWHKALEVHNQQNATKMMNAMLYRVALKQKMTPERLEQVQELRTTLQGIEELDPNDKVVWFFEIAAGSDAEIIELMALSTGQADPTEKGVSLEQSNFRSSV